MCIFVIPVLCDNVQFEIEMLGGLKSLNTEQSRAKPRNEVFISEIFTLFHRILKIFPGYNLLHQSLNHVIELYKIY